MRKGFGAATVVAASAALVLAGSATALATVTPMSKHTGTAGCFNWSWADGTISTTVYFHNTCTDTETITISWSQGHFVAGDIAPNGKGHAQGTGHVIAIDDLGPSA